MLKLSKKHIDYLSKHPEHGMGYHLVTVVLNDGTKLEERTVLNGASLKLEDGEKLKIDDIAKIIVKN